MDQYYEEGEILVKEFQTHFLVVNTCTSPVKAGLYVSEITE